MPCYMLERLVPAKPGLDQEKPVKAPETPRPVCGWWRCLGRSPGLGRNLDPASSCTEACYESLVESLCVFGLCYFSFIKSAVWAKWSLRSLPAPILDNLKLLKKHKQKMKILAR